MLKPNTTILAIDASTEICSLALLCDEKLSSDVCDIPKSHAKVLLPMVDDLLSRASISLESLDYLAVSRGPGSFTGIRICMSVAQALSFGANIPILAFNSLEVLAKQASTHVEPRLLKTATLIAALDARMNEVYWAAYSVDSLGQLVEEIEPRVSEVAEMNRYIEGLSEPPIGFGHGFRVEGCIALQEPSTVRSGCLPMAQDMIKLLLQESDPLQRLHSDGLIEPLYLRNEVAWQKRQRIREHTLV